MSKQQPVSRLQLPRDAISRINLGQSFAEYDRLLDRPEVFVVTPAIQAALDPTRSKCFFVGRRGTGKTAITYYLMAKKPNVVQVHPQLFTSLSDILSGIDLQDTRQRPVQSLVAAFRRSIVDEVLAACLKRHHVRWIDLDDPLTAERNFIEDHDFDTRTIAFADEAFAAIKNGKESNWLRFIRRSKEQIANAFQDAIGPLQIPEFLILIDRLDETWDGSDSAVVLLLALMHACVEVAGSVRSIRPMLFLRENIFERIRKVDNEFTRLETCVVSLDWTKELLRELVERRLQLPLNPKPRIGDTWDLFFEPTTEGTSQDLVFQYCQHRPRDVLTYCALAVESAQSQRHERILIEDLQEARRRFSESRLKDVGDEYSENYPHIALVMNRFHGLAREMTVYAVEGFIKKLLVDEEVAKLCNRWLFRHTAPHQFIELLFGIGFWGIRDGEEIIFRGVGVRSASIPPLTSHSHVVIHPSYIEALDLQEKVLSNLDEAITLQKEGLLIDLPEAFSPKEFEDRLSQLQMDIETIPEGNEHNQQYEAFVGELLRLCFFRVLTNVQQHVRDVEGRVIRDWIASNVAANGFWEMVRQRHHATQVVWECKNYSALTAGDFHQTAYYMNPQIGHFVVVCFRGEEGDKAHYMQHIRRVSQNHGGMVLLLTDKDMKVFIRQALNGKAKESHIREIYDTIIRKIS